MGVVTDLYDDGAHRPPPGIVYWPARVQTASMGVQQYIPRSMAFAIRSNRTGTESVLREIQEAVWSVNSTLRLAEVQTLADVSRKSVAQASFTLVMLAIAGGMALGLSLIGIYGVLSYSVSRRVREIGIRIALGVERGALRRMFVKQGLILGAIGVAIGLPRRRSTHEALGIIPVPHRSPGFPNLRLRVARLIADGRPGQLLTRASRRRYRSCGSAAVGIVDTLARCASLLTRWGRDTR